jgi:hypothetical protein
MDARVWKFEFDIEDPLTIKMPQGARVLHVDLQDGLPCMWALVDASEPLVARKFRIIGTGHPIKDIAKLTYLTSFQMSDGELVWHVFEPRLT